MLILAFEADYNSTTFFRVYFYLTDAHCVCLQLCIFNGRLYILLGRVKVLFIFILSLTHCSFFIGGLSVFSS